MHSAQAAAGACRDEDPRFGAICGGYLGLLATPPVVLLVAWTVSRSPVVLAVTLVAALVTVGLATAWWLRSRPSLAVALGATRKRWAFIALAVGYAVAGFAQTGAVGPVGLVAVACGLFASVFGIAIAVMSHTRYAVSATTGRPELARWTASWPEREQRRRLRHGGAFAGVATVGFAVGTILESSLLQYTGQVLFPSGFVLITTGGTRTAVATDAGLEVRHPGARRFYAWDDLSGYDLDSEALVLTREWGADLRFATAEIDDVSLVEWTLAERLDDA
ncbi:hypothetical protein [Haloarcula salina]|uniref:PH domain-containing protein n=1 Tax=Haloarcula salina TaxID=1429914 RepID=A0AA41G1D1_9EURY|nr:hypothetical protein [Haloarcula salina]MBV0901724.1 hypothetical protein [Haloarcula salina]